MKLRLGDGTQSPLSGRSKAGAGYQFSTTDSSRKDIFQPRRPPPPFLGST